MSLLVLFALTELLIGQKAESARPSLARSWPSLPGKVEPWTLGRQKTPDDAHATLAGVSLVQDGLMVLAQQSSSVLLDCCASWLTRYLEA